MATIGFIGLGNMGGPMVANLVKAGHIVKAFDLSPVQVGKAIDDGAQGAQSAQEAATDVDFLVSMLPAGKHVESLLVTGEGALFDVVSPNTLVIDSSTIDAATAKRVAEVGASKGISFVDAPVSGGVGGAVAGTLAFMVGGTAEQFAKAQPILACMGKNIFHFKLIVLVPLFSLSLPAP